MKFITTFFKRVEGKEDANRLLNSFWNKLTNMPMKIYKEFDYDLINESARLAYNIKETGIRW